MAKILTVTPSQGETDAAFAARVAAQADEFFGDQSAPTDVGAESQAPTEAPTGEQAPSA